jgi:hypothetical protein
MADSKLKRPYTTSKVSVGTFTLPSKTQIDSEGSLPRTKVVDSSSDPIRCIKKGLNLRHTLVGSSSRAAVDLASLSSRTSALNRLLKFETEPRKQMKLLRGSLIPKKVLRPASAVKKTRPLSAHAWQIRIKRQQQADMTAPTKLMQVEGFYYNKSVSATTVELHRQHKPLHELNQRPLRKMYQQSSELYEPRLRPRGTAANSKRGSCENSSNDASHDNFIIISRAPRHTQTCSSRLRLQSKAVKAAAETQTDRVVFPLEVLGIAEDDEVESPLFGARYFAL